MVCPGTRAPGFAGITTTGRVNVVLEGMSVVLPPSMPDAALRIPGACELPLPHGALRPPALPRRRGGRVTGAVTLASGDVIGDPEAGPGGTGAGGKGGTIRARHGRDAVETGDEAITAWTAPPAAGCSREGRAMRTTVPGPR